MTRSKIRTSGAEGLTLSSTSLTIANGLTLTDGNVTLASGHGLNFAATGDGSGTDSSELFEDYEEGTWTPTLPNGGTASNNHSSYVKIGKMVYAYVYLTMGSMPNDSLRLSIGGLPYACNSTSDYYAGGTLGYTGDYNSSIFLQPLVSTGNSYLYFHRNDGNSAAIKNSDVDGANRYFIMSVAYRTD